MLDAQTITWILVGVFMIKYSTRIAELYVKKEDKNAKAKHTVIFTLTLIFSVLLVTSMPIGMRVKRDTLNEIVMHHHPNANILKKIEYDKYGVVYYTKGNQKKVKFAYYINDNGWKLADKKYFDHPFDDFSIEKESNKEKVLITFNMLKDRKQTFVYFHYDGLNEKLVNSGNDIIHDTLFTKFERIPSNTGSTYVG